MSVIIRQATGEDAEGIISYMKEVSGEPGLYLGLDIGEFDPTVEEERELIEKSAASDNSKWLVAIATNSEREKWNLEDGEMVGLLNCTGGKRRGNRHNTTLGITTKLGWRGHGIGTMLMERAIEWAKESGVVKRVELEVLEENVQAMKLYERLGFVKEGVRRKAFWKHEKWMDSVVMGLIIE